MGKDEEEEEEEGGVPVAFVFRSGGKKTKEIHFNIQVLRARYPGSFPGGFDVFNRKRP